MNQPLAGFECRTANIIGREFKNLTSLLGIILPIIMLLVGTIFLYNAYKALRGNVNGISNQQMMARKAYTASDIKIINTYFID